MATSSTKRTRSERVAALQLEPSIVSRYLKQLVTGKSLLQIAIGAVAAILLVIILQGWRTPFSYREGQVPDRDIVARVAFEVIDTQQTKLLRDQQRREVLCFYENRSEPILQLRSAIKDQLISLLGEKPLEQLEPAQQAALDQFLKSDDASEKLSRKEALQRIRSLLTAGDQLEKFDQAMRTILDPIAESGILKSLSHDNEKGSQRSIIVFPVGQPDADFFVDVPRVRRTEVVAELPQKVAEVFQQTFTSPDAVIVAELVSDYLVDRLPETLSYRQDLSEQARRKAEESVEDARVSYFPTISKLAAAGQPLSRSDSLPLLRAEYDAWVQQLSTGETTVRLIAFIGMIFALYLLCGIYIYYQYEPTLLTEPKPLLRLLGLVVLTCLFCKFTAPDPLRAEIVPLVLCAMTATIAFGRQVALLVSTCLALAVTLGLGLDIGEFVTLCGGTCAAALLLGRIRTRTRLIYVGMAAGAIVALTHLGVDTVAGKLSMVVPSASAEMPDEPQTWLTLLPGLVAESLRLGGFTLLAGTLMPALLPFVEKAFGVQTDLSLLELGDASHQLLRQLAQRAPGTYNHSINVAAIAEAAADSIGAHGLLTRVGAYFHDIGKMFKPNYFVENQEQGGNCHDTLQPAMSTLVIIAHVKDGADLGRQHRLPKPIIDFIEQHHGTTLVEYFYREAAKRSQADPNKEEVSETSFRYPGPKPQTLEAAVLMLADSVESASRTLVEPTSSRIQNLVDQIAMKKLLDGQFDQCGLTLQQLDLLKNSLVKSLTAIYHGRVKYSGQASA
ncbi:MAG: HDIG domain-containing protein [Pirellulaceae bacterium]